MFDVGVNGTYDEASRVSFKSNPSTTISWWLVSSYCYYIHDESLLSDSVYDLMSKYMLNNWDKLEHQHKHMITKEDLMAASGFAIERSEYPLIIQVTAQTFMDGLEKWRNKNS